LQDGVRTRRKKTELSHSNKAEETYSLSYKEWGVQLMCVSECHVQGGPFYFLIQRNIATGVDDVILYFISLILFTDSKDFWK